MHDRPCARALPEPRFKGGEKAIDYVRGNSKSTVAVHTQVNLDGKKIATVVTRHQANDANRPQTGLSTFDGKQALAPSGVTGAW
jgi:hypothetical protein